MAKNSDFDTAVQEEIDAGETVVVSADNPVGIARSNVMYITLNEIGERGAAFQFDTRALCQPQAPDVVADECSLHGIMQPIQNLGPAACAHLRLLL